ncbi:MAG TPA: class E sortase [Thermoleophilaceae bacterium]|nr:class E sortase [Thermoleophilaceae bacterium]
MARTLLRQLSTILILAGLMLLADVGVTLLWQEPVSAVYAEWRQEALADDLEELSTPRLDPAELEALERLPLDTDRAAFLARALERRTEPGDAVGRIRIPEVGASTVIVEGTDSGSLREGPGHYPETPLPGIRGTVAVAGHRTTYGAPFRDLDKLEERDEVVVEMPYGRFIYAVEREEIVDPSAVWVTRRVGHDRLVLTACHPKYSAAQRIVIFARLLRAEHVA